VSAVWVSVIAIGAGTAALKAVGPVAVAGRRVPPRLLGLLAMLAPALLAALVIDEGFASGRSLVLDARVAGLAAGALAVALRAPIWAVVVAGGAATALVRLVS